MFADMALSLHIATGALNCAKTTIVGCRGTGTGMDHGMSVHTARPWPQVARMPTWNFHND